MGCEFARIVQPVGVEAGALIEILFRIKTTHGRDARATMKFRRAAFGRLFFLLVEEELRARWKGTRQRRVGDRRSGGVSKPFVLGQK